MVEYKLVMSTKDGKSYQKEIQSPQADVLHDKRIGDKISGKDLGYDGYEFEITGGSDKCGFPMRRGIQFARKRIFAGKSVGISGKDRNKKKRGGLLRRKTVCGERVTKIIRQINLKVLKEGKQSLAEAAAPEEKPAEAAAEAPKAAPESKEAPKEEALKEEAAPEEESNEEKA